MSCARPLLVAALLAALPPPAAAVVGPARDGDGYADRVVMVLARHGGRQSICSGVALAPRWVLTAAHCLGAAADTLVAVRTGGRTAPVPVAAVIRHPGYDPAAPAKRRVSIDLGLVQLAAPLQGFKFAEIEDAAAAPGDPVTLVGFGVTREGGPASDGHALAADLAVTEPLSKVTLWTADPSRSGLGACHGDSGGPLFTADGKLIAIVAWTNGLPGHGCGAITQGPLIAPARDWIATVRAAAGE
jgi:S1-C subfamily serine protease